MKSSNARRIRNLVLNGTGDLAMDTAISTQIAFAKATNTDLPIALPFPLYDKKSLETN